MVDKPSANPLWMALFKPKTAGIVGVLFLYSGSLVLDLIASSYPPVSRVYACRTVEAAQRLSGFATDLIVAGGVISLAGLALATGRRRWYLALLLAVPLLVVIRIESVLDPGQNCHTVF